MKNKILLTIFIICFIASVILAFIPPEQACGGEETGCYIVSESEYAQTIGINNSYMGLIAFILLISLTISHIKKPKKQKEIFQKIILIPMGMGAIYFISLQIFVIKAYCQYCMIIDIGILLSIPIIFYNKQWHKKSSTLEQKQ